MRVKRLEGEIKQKLLGVCKSEDDEISLERLFDIFKDNGVNLTQKDTLEIIRRHELPEFKTNYRKVIKDLYLNRINEVWTLKLPNEKSYGFKPHWIVDYGAKGYTEHQIKESGQRYILQQKKLKNLAFKDKLEMVLSKRLMMLKQEKE